MVVPGSSAVVVGAGMAGLLAAQALSGTFAEVTVVERDHVGQSAAHRPGLPQDRHVHTLWAGGLQAIDALLPGIEEDLVAAGGYRVAFWSDFQWLLPIGRWCTRWPATQGIVSCSRTLLEHVVRVRVRRAGRVRLIDGQRVTGLRLGPAGAVRGVELAPRGHQSPGDELPADLVVDAGGRRSGLVGWLAARGLAQPAESTVDPFVGYATRLVTLPPHQQADFKGLYVQLAPPRHTRGGIMFPIEGGRWVVTLLGACRDYPPTDPDGYLEFARSLRSTMLYDTVKDAEPASPVWGHRHTANHRRHYERLSTMPAGLLAVGDSLCAFNPIYGQGMTVAALQARALGTLVRQRVRAPADAARLSRPAQRVMAKIAGQAWMVSATEDLRYPVTGDPGYAVRLLHRYMDRVMLAATVDATVANTFLRVLNMLDRPTSLQRPDVMLRVLSSARAAR
ncbi:MAG TPA: FAD-dependent monooxygenase [Micromonosporaceae bacterium]|nr:FAD-dependent monooxygenase [Micromonosporaceae bacterium]